MRQDRTQKMWSAITDLIDDLSSMVKKDKLSDDDKSRLTAVKQLNSTLNIAVNMRQQDNAERRIALIAERMRHLGFFNPRRVQCEESPALETCTSGQDSQSPQNPYKPVKV